METSNVQSASFRQVLLSFILTFLFFYSSAGRAAEIIQIAIDAEGLPFLLDDAGHVWAFRDPTNGGMSQLVRISGLEHIKKIAPYEALDDKGQVFVWGLLNVNVDDTNSIFQTSYTPATKLLSLSGVTDIAHSFSHGFAVVNGNRIVTWEEITRDAHGNWGYEITKYGPIQEIYTVTRIKHLAAAPGSHELMRPSTLIALLEDGTVLGWGISEFGQETFRGGERIELGKFPDAVDVALNNRHTVVLTKQGVPLFWGGCDIWGQNNSGKPWTWGHIKNAPGAINDVQSLALNNDTFFGSNARFDIFLKRDGTVWGARAPTPPGVPDSECGIHGNSPSQPYQLVIGDAPATQVSVGNSIVLVLDKKHRLWSWGNIGNIIKLELMNIHIPSST